MFCEMKNCILLLQTKDGQHLGLFTKDSLYQVGWTGVDEKQPDPLLKESDDYEYIQSWLYGYRDGWDAMYINNGLCVEQ
jgi:hypothetical protein